MTRYIAALILSAFFCIASSASAETLLIERVKQKPVETQSLRGQSMAAVEARFGAPSQKLEPRGGQKSQWPTIYRWVYPSFTVYFEKQRVIDVVVNQLSSNGTLPRRY
jgi:hypothetical protein